MADQTERELLGLAADLLNVGLGKDRGTTDGTKDPALGVGMNRGPTSLQC